MKSLLSIATLEFIGLGGLIAIFAYIPWTQMVLGAVLTMVGAFYPHSSADKAKGQGHLNSARFSALFKGSLRAGVVIAGILLIIGAVVDGYSRKEARDEIEKELAGNSIRRIPSSTPNATDPRLRQRLEEMIEKAAVAKAAREIAEKAEADAAAAEAAAAKESGRVTGRQTAKSLAREMEQRLPVEREESSGR